MKYIQKQFLILLALLPAGVFAQSGPQWPVVKPTMKPWTRWWWQGSAVEQSELKKSLEAYAQAGLGGVEVTPIYGVRGAERRNLTYLSPRWVDAFTYTLNEAKRLGIGVDLANASGWPFGGPWVTDESASKSLRMESYEVTGGRVVNLKVSCEQAPRVRFQGSKTIRPDELKYPLQANGDLQEIAFDQVRFAKTLPLVTLMAYRAEGGQYSGAVDLTSLVKDGQLTWKAPKGNWLLCAIFKGDHGKMVERAAPGGEGFVIDHFSADALHQYLQKFDDAFRGRDLSYLRYYFNDSYEVDDAEGESDYTDRIFDHFYHLNHYRLQDCLPALMGKDTEERNMRVLYDYRMTIDSLLVNVYTKGWQGWAARQGKGIRNQGHGSPANILDIYAASDVPEIEGSDIIALKTAPSAAHVMGKPLVSSESATWANEHFMTSLEEVKNILDGFWLAGVNHVFYHGTAYSPSDAKWPGWLFYAAVHFQPTNSWWDDFSTLNRYAARVQSFMQQGRPSGDILLYYSLGDYQSKPDRKMLRHFHGVEMPEVHDCAQKLYDSGFDWDLFTDRQLQTFGFNGGVTTPGGRYRVIVIPAAKLMPIATLKRLMALAADGATVIFDKHLPTDVPGLAGLEAARREMQTLLGGLSFRNGVASCGRGRIVCATDLAAALREAGVSQEPMFAEGLRCIRRQNAEGGYSYFIKNPTDRIYSGQVALGTSFSTAAVFNPMDGRKGLARVTDNRVFLSLQPGEALIVQTSTGEMSGEPYAFYMPAGEPQQLQGRWKIEFVKGGPVLPKAHETTDLRSWTVFDADAAAFSGTARYAVTLPKLKQKAPMWRLSLGEVHETARVYVGTTFVGTLLGAPYQLDIPSSLLKKGTPLIIEVTNLMANRISDMDRKGEPYRIFYNTNFPARKAENRRSDNLFTAKAWSPQPSGLIGPVVLQPLQPLAD